MDIAYKKINAFSKSEARWHNFFLKLLTWIMLKDSCQNTAYRTLH